MQNQTSTEAKLSYADALLEARGWLVGFNSADGSTLKPMDEAFVPWYAWNARRYEVDTAYDYYTGDAGSQVLVLREGEGEVSGTELRGERALHPSNDARREVVPPSKPVPLYKVGQQVVVTNPYQLGAVFYITNVVPNPFPLRDHGDFYYLGDPASAGVWEKYLAPHA